MYKKLLYTAALIFFNIILAQSQEGVLIIRDILFVDNFRTQESVILRELTFEKGDTITIVELEEHFKRSKFQILSTGLFNSVQLNLKNYNGTSPKTDIEIKVEENWYIYPVPIFELADRNFNVWWKDQGRALDRVNYGGRISHYNFTGNRDPLKFKAHFGYTRKFELTYQRPYWKMDKQMMSANFYLGFVLVPN